MDLAEAQIPALMKFRRLGQTPKAIQISLDVDLHINSTPGRHGKSLQDRITAIALDCVLCA
jgi:hypothetical protein